MGDVEFVIPRVAYLAHTRSLHLRVLSSSFLRVLFSSPRALTSPLGGVDLVSSRDNTSPSHSLHLRVSSSLKLRVVFIKHTHTNFTSGCRRVCFSAWCLSSPRRLTSPPGVELVSSHGAYVVSSSLSLPLVLAHRTHFTSGCLRARFSACCLSSTPTLTSPPGVVEFVSPRVAYQTHPR